MDIGYSSWERRDSADRNELGLAALAYCRAMKGVDGVGDARFYWPGIDTLAILVHVESSGVLYRQPSPALAKATFALADLALQTTNQVWLDAPAGAMLYEASQQ